MSGKNPAPRDIEDDLSRTRSRLGGHLTELRSRTTPGQVIDELMTYFRGKEGIEFGRNLMDGVRSNPLPAAITGIGLTWLMASNPGNRQNAGSGSSSRRVDRDGAGGSWDKVAVGHDSTSQGHYPTAPSPEPTREPYETESAFSARVDTTRAKSLGIERDANESDSTFKQRIQDGFAALKQSTVEAGHDMRDKVGGLADSMGSTASSARSAVSSATQQSGQSIRQGSHAVGDKTSSLIATLVESPVLLGALGLAAGAVLGALLPQSDQEEEALGGIAGQARQAARGLVQETVDRGGAVAQSVVDAGQDSAQEHGLAGDKSAGALVDAALDGSLATDAKQVAQDVLHTGDKAIREQTGDA